MRWPACADPATSFLSSPSDRFPGLANGSEAASLGASASRRSDHLASTPRPSRNSGRGGPGTRFGYTYALRIGTSSPSPPSGARMRRGPSPPEVAVAEGCRQTLPGLCPGTRPPASRVSHCGTLDAGGSQFRQTEALASYSGWGRPYGCWTLVPRVPLPVAPSVPAAQRALAPESPPLQRQEVYRAW